jgi:two-component system response regulator (stage 0 sporulation protein F)
MKNPSQPIIQVLVVEDDGELRKVLCESLSRAGYGVTEAADGAQASALLRAKPFDLVITDLYMPKRDGFEVIIELRQRQPSAKIIAISGHPTRQRMLPAAAWLGARRTIAKPFTPQEMLELIKEVLAEP